MPGRTSDARPQASSRWPGWLPLLLAVLTLSTYGNSLWNGFVWDDVPVVVEGTIARGPAALPDIVLSPDMVKPYFRPVTRASYLVDGVIGGGDAAFSHGVNVALHLANVLVLFFVARRLFGNSWLAFGAAVLLAVHPVNAETVDFVSARNNLFALLFLQGALALLALAFSRGSVLAAWGSALAWFLALGSKESAGAGIILLLAYAVWPLARSTVLRRRRLAFLAPHALFLGAYLALRAVALGGNPGDSLHPGSLSEALRVNYHVVPAYLEVLILPWRTNVFHAIPRGGVGAHPELLVAWGLLAAATVGLVVQRSPPSIAGLAWLVVNFAPIANVIPIPSAAMAERFLYLPAVGIWLIVADQALRIVAALRWKRAATVAIGAVVPLLAGVTARRNLDWRDDVTLFRSSVARETTTQGLFNLGTALREAGDLEGAQRAWRRAIEMDPRDAGSLAQLGTLAAVRGEFAEAERLYRAALEVEPDNPTVHLNLARVLERTGNRSEAIRQYDRYLELAPADERAQTQAARVARQRLEGPP